MPHKALRGDVPLPMRAYNARREQAHTPLVHADSRKAQGGDGRHTEGGAIKQWSPNRGAVASFGDGGGHEAGDEGRGIRRGGGR